MAPARAATGGAPRPRTGVATARPARRAPGATLSAQSGPAAGQEFTLDGDEVVLGRAADNAVSIPDTSVSRKHALVRRTADGWALSDLGSGNGTLLNGEPVEDEVTLGDGDVITMGDTELRYSGGGAAEAGEAAAGGARRPPVRTARAGGTPARGGGRVRTSRMQEDPEQARQKRRKLFVAFGGILVVVMAAGVGWKAIDNKRKLEEQQRLVLAREHQDEMATMFKEAKSLVKAGKWIEAKAKLEEMQAADPDYEARSVANYLQNAANEIPVQQQLAEAGKHLAAGEVGKAYEVLQGVKTTNQELALRNAKEALETKIGEKLGEARNLTPFASDLAKMEQLKAITEDILVARPEDREATELKKVAETAIYRIKNPSIAPPPPDTPWLEVHQRFKNGDASGALSLAQACANKHAQCRQLEGNIKDFEAKSKRLEDLNENELIALYELDKRIAGGSSSDLSKPVRTQLVSKLFVKASQAKTTGNWSRAIDYARKVLQADPAHAGAQALVNEARNQAREIYLRGYQLKESNPDEAIKLFKDVMNMTPPDDENHQKARSRVAELQK